MQIITAKKSRKINMVLLGLVGAFGTTGRWLRTIQASVQTAV